uniref:Protein Wnt n=1 Tax=Strigamia maritima TaxID=126957 RepID=T1IPH0_STRMM
MDYFVPILGLVSLFQIILSSSDYNNLHWDTLLLRSSALCNSYSGLKRKQVALCRKFPDVAAAAMRGLELSADECRHQMRHNRWNCSSVSAEDPRSSAIYKLGYRESALVTAIINAGMVQSVWRACRLGSVVSCGCHPHRPRRGRSWAWAGCGDEASFAVYFARSFYSAVDRSKDLRSKTIAHNGALGRKIVARNVEVRCKCHGMSGSCQMKTCWRAPPDFQVIGDRLHNRYDYAVLVESENRRDAKLRLAFRSARRHPRATDLVFYEKSPTFCDLDPARDSWGTQDRACNKTSFNVDNCGALCCGRGYNTMRVKRTEKCNCRFHWCCHVKCEECVHEDWITICK